VAARRVRPRSCGPRDPSALDEAARAVRPHQDDLVGLSLGGAHRRPRDVALPEILRRADGSVRYRLRAHADDGRARDAVRARRRTARRGLPGAQHDVRRHVPRRQRPHPSGRRHPDVHAGRSDPRTRIRGARARSQGRNGRHGDSQAVSGSVSRRAAVRAVRRTLAIDRDRSAARLRSVLEAVRRTRRSAAVSHLAHRRAAPAARRRTTSSTTSACLPAVRNIFAARFFWAA
jgi:hypothetical protein